MKTTSIPASHPSPILGVDIGRVIIAGDGPDTSFVGGSEEDALRAPALPGVFEALERLCRRFRGHVWLVSKCGKRVEGRTRTWLAHHRFFERTGIDPSHLVFCRTRPEKTPICAGLGVTCFVDDRTDVLVPMKGIVPTRVLFGARTSPEPGLVAAVDWEVAEGVILEETPFTESEGSEAARAP
jgi:hypothetical protein